MDDHSNLARRFFEVIDKARQLAPVVLVLICLAPTDSPAETFRVERPDENYFYRLQDWDIHQGQLRFLFKTSPAEQQWSSDPDNWPNRLFVAEVSPDGSHKIYPLGTWKGSPFKFALRRGFPEAFAVDFEGNQGAPKRLQVWSIPDSVLRLETIVEDLPGTHSGVDLHASSDGNLFSVAPTKFFTGGYRGPSAIGWVKLSPAGEVLASGEASRPDAQISTTGMFTANNDGLGLALSLFMAEDYDSLVTEIDVPIRRNIGSSVMEAVVASETRLLVTDANGKTRWTSSALQRTLGWLPPPAGFSQQEYLRQSDERSRIMNDVQLTHAFGDRQLGGMRGRSATWVKATPNGYGVLARVVSGLHSDSGVYGPSFLEVGEDGSIRREVYLQPVAEALKGRFTDFLATGDGGLLLLGSGGPSGGMFVTRVAADGAFQWVQELGDAVDPGQPLGLIGTENNAWVFGRSNEGKMTLWLGRVDASVANRSLPPSATEQPREAPRPREAAKPLDIPECACTCEEGNAVNSFMTQMQSTRDPAQIQAMMNDPLMKKAMCMGLCRKDYAACGP